MKKWLVGISLIVIAGGATYVAWHSREVSWLAAAATAVLGLIGMTLCLARARYAALFAAITLLMLTGVGQGVHAIVGTLDAAVTGRATFEVKFEGPSPWPTLFGVVALLAFQGLLEIIDRQTFQKLAARFSVVMQGSIGPGSTAINNSTTGSVTSANISGDNHGMIAVGTGNTLVQINTDLDGEIQSAADLLKGGRVRSAKAAFEKLSTRYGSNLTSHQRYRITANLGFIAHRNGELERAASLFKQAAELTSDRNISDRLLAQAESAHGSYENAVTIAQTVLSRDASDVDAAVIRIVNDWSDATTEDIRNDLVSEIRDTVQVLFACIFREGSKENLSSAERLAREAFNLYPDDCYIQMEVARAVVCRLQQKYGYRATPSALHTEEKNHLEEAIAHATNVLRNQELELTEAKQVDLYSIRGIARSLLGRLDEALGDWDEAAAMSSSIERHLLPYVVRLHEAGRSNDAIERLKSALQKKSDLVAACLYSELLLERDAPGDRQTAVLALREAITTAPHPASVDLTTAFIDLSRVSIVRDLPEDHGFFDLLEATQDRLSDMGRRVVLAHAAMASENEAEADFQASMAILAIPTASNGLEIRQLAIVLNLLKRHAECANLMSTRCSPGMDCDKAQLLLQAAHDAELDALVLEQLRDLRRQGSYVGRLIKNEAIVLARYLAIDLLTELLEDVQRHCSDSSILNWIRFMRSLAAVGVGCLEFVEHDPTRLPSACDLRMDELANLSKVMRFGPGLREGIDQIYALMRKDRTAIEPQRVFFAMMSVGDDFESIIDPEVVGVGSAVHVKQATGPDLWCIIEDGENPDSTQNEFAIDSPVVAPLIGKRIRDTVVVARGFGTNTLKIKRIVDKRNYAKMKIMESYPDLHPEDGFLMRFDMAGRDGKLDLRILGVQMQFWESEKDKQLEVYRQQPLPMVCVAEATRRPLASVWMHVSQTEDLPLRLIFGREEEILNADAGFQSRTPLVLDSTAAVTLLMTGLWKSLGSSEFKIIVPTAVLNDIWCLIADSPYRSDGGSSLHVIGDHPYAEDGSLEGWARYRWRAGLFLIWLQQHCTLVDSISLAKMSPKRRKALLEIFGLSTATAIAIAIELKAVLWPDDVVAASLGCQFGVLYRVWTLAVADECVRRGNLNEAIALDLKTDMLSYGAIHILLEPEVVLRAGERAKWDSRHQPLRGICHWFSNPDLLTDPVCEVLCAVLLAIHKRDLMWHQEESTCLAIFRATSERPDGNQVLRALHRRVPSLFPFEVIYHDKVRKLIQRSIQ